MSAASSVLTVSSQRISRSTTEHPSCLTYNEPTELLSDKPMSRQGTCITFESRSHFPTNVQSLLVRIFNTIDGPCWWEKRDGSVSSSHPWPSLISQRAVHVHYYRSTCTAEAVDIGDRHWRAPKLCRVHLPLAWTCKHIVGAVWGWKPGAGVIQLPTFLYN